MPYGILKADTLTYYTATGDVNLAISGIALQGAALVSGVSGIFTTVVSGATVTGNAGQFTTITGGTANFANITGVSGTFTTRISGATVTGNTAQFTTATAVTGVFTTSVSGATVTGDLGLFNTLSGNQVVLATGLSIPSGSASSPSISVNGDPNTGLYSPGADQVAISTNGTGRLFVDASGSVGINKAPGVTIDTQSTGSNCTLALNRTDAATAGQIQIAAGNNANSILSTGTKDLFFSTNSLERLRITSAGLVGIGTSSPGAPLDARGFATYRGNVYTIASFCANSTNTPLNILQGIDGTHPSISAGQNSTGTWGALGFVTSEQYRMLITNAGNVGIGTTPETTLDVNGAITLRAVSIPGTGKARIYERDTDNKLYIQTGTGNAIRFINNLQNDLLNIDSSGRLLVGTSTARSNFFGAAPGIAPQLQLEGGDTAASTLSITRNNNDGDGPTLAFGKSRSTTNTVVQSGDRIGRIEFQGNDATSFVRSAVIEAFVDGTPGANDMPGRLVFSTTADGASSPTERVRISQNGVVTVKNGAVAEIGTLTDGATVTPDFAANCNFTLTISGNRTLANPTNITAGQTGSIFIIQGSGSNTLSWGSYWDFAGGTAPTLSTASGAIDRVDYVVRTSTSIHTVFTANYS